MDRPETHGRTDSGVRDEARPAVRTISSPVPGSGIFESGAASSPYRACACEGVRGSVFEDEDEVEGQKSGLLSSGGGGEGKGLDGSEFGTVVPFSWVQVAGAEGSGFEEFSFLSQNGWKVSG